MRRRLPRRPLRRRPAGLRPNRPPIPPKLIQAHKLFDAGEYGQAATLYIALAEKAEERGLPQAPNLFLRSSAALMKDGDLEKAEEMIKRGLGIYAAKQKWFQLHKAGRITIDRLTSEGQSALAGRIQSWLDKQVPEEIKQSDGWQRTTLPTGSGSVKLPSTCSQCGGPVNPKEVDWYDANNPVCSFCGTVLQRNG
jgi:hypothetical protein